MRKLLARGIADRTLVLYENVGALREEDASNLCGLDLDASVVIVPFLDSVASGEVRCVDMYLSEGIVAEAYALVSARAKSHSENNKGQKYSDLFHFSLHMCFVAENIITLTEGFVKGWMNKKRRRLIPRHQEIVVYAVPLCRNIRYYLLFL